MTPTKEEIEAVLAGCDGVTPGPWFTDTEKNDGSYGFGEDTHEGFDSPVLFSETVDYYGKPDRICDAINASVIEVAEEFGEDSHSAWDEQGRKNFAHIARLSPEVVRELAALALEALSSREAGWQGKIKPLEWRFYPDAFSPAWDAETPWGRYSIEEHEHNVEDPALPHPDISLLAHLYFASRDRGIFPNIDAAKAAAQKDFESRIRPALLPTPPDQGSKSP